MFNTIQVIKNVILDTLFPASCIGCGTEGVWLCTTCKSSIPHTEIPCCPLCKKIVSGHTCGRCSADTTLDGLIVATSYENKLIQDTIHLFKYQYVQSLAHPLGNNLIRAVQYVDRNTSFSYRNTVVVPVPLHRHRLLERGFNQSALLGKVVAEHYALDFFPEVLVRQKKTEHQAQLDRQSRIQNISGAFTTSEPFNLMNKSVILVDDVATTLATLQACSDTLKQAGVRRVWGLVIARGS